MSYDDQPKKKLEDCNLGELEAAVKETNDELSRLGSQSCSLQNKTSEANKRLSAVKDELKKRLERLMR